MTIMVVPNLRFSVRMALAGLVQLREMEICKPQGSFSPEAPFRAPDQRLGLPRRPGPAPEGFLALLGAEP